ncbi:hypothetical protein DTO003C3_10180 [Penicillium roqueforti]|nr:hypothetical protein DTO003C3_10180 [Penicillium roqueforti]
MALNTLVTRLWYRIVLGLALLGICQASPAAIRGEQAYSKYDSSLLQNLTVSRRELGQLEDGLHFLSKRAPPGAEKAENELFCYLRADTAPHSDWTIDQLNDCWTFEEYPAASGGITGSGVLMPQALAALKIPQKAGEKGVTGFYWVQDQEFPWQGRDQAATYGFYQGSMSVEAGYISSEWSENPKQKEGDPYPEPYKLSDVLFLEWQREAEEYGQNIKNLKYFFRVNVVNTHSLRIINEATGNVIKEWPGTSFDMSTPEGKAILRTPNGVGVAYFLINHKPELGKRIPTKVTVFKTMDGAKQSIHLLFYIGVSRGRR